jgi:hypothetical protein
MCDAPSTWRASTWAINPLYTDARIFSEHGIPAVLYGCGPRTVLESNAKRADEHIVLEDLRRAIKVVARTLAELLDCRSTGNATFCGAVAGLHVNLVLAVRSRTAPDSERICMTTAAIRPYPRNLLGHGRHPPHAQWPGQARVALQFVLNYEEGAENSVLHGDAASEQINSEMFRRHHRDEPHRILAIHTQYQPALWFE